MAVPTDVRTPPRGAHLAIFLWGVLCVVLFLSSAVFRMAPYALEVIGELGALQWALVGAWIFFMVYAEGYRGFHLRFSPRVVARAYHLGTPAGRKPLHVVLALFYSMAIFHTTKRQRIVSGVFLTFLVLLIVLVRQLPQPARGMVDMGVVVGLSMGILSILYHSLRAAGGTVPQDAALPESAQT